MLFLIGKIIKLVKRPLNSLRDKTNLTNCREAKRYLAFGFIAYKKAYDMVPHSLLKETLKLLGVAGNIRRLLGQSTRN